MREGDGAAFSGQGVRGDERRRHVLNGDGRLIKGCDRAFIPMHAQPVGGGIRRAESELKRTCARSSKRHLCAIRFEKRQKWLGGKRWRHRASHSVRAGCGAGRGLGVIVGAVPDSELAVCTVEIAIGCPVGAAKPVVQIGDPCQHGRRAKRTTQHAIPVIFDDAPGSPGGLINHRVMKLLPGGV